MSHSSAKNRFTTIKAAVAAIKEERAAVTIDQVANSSGEIVTMPYGGSMPVHFTRLPWFEFNRTRLEKAIRAALDRKDELGYTILPIADIVLNRRSNVVTVIVDRERLDEIQPWIPPVVATN